jgi:GxxExxY protein
MITKSYLTNLVYKVNGAAIEVHKAIGPGLLESVYHQCLKYELFKRNIHFVSEMKIPIHYKEINFETDLRCDLLVEGSLIVELKSVNKIEPIFEAKLLSYMKIMNIAEGLMINFNVLNIYRDGQKTYVNELYRDLPA